MPREDRDAAAIVRRQIEKEGVTVVVGAQILAVPANRQVVSGTRDNFTGSTQPVKVSPNGTYWYLFKYFPDRNGGPPELTGNDLVESGIAADLDQNGQPEVVLQFTGKGSNAFQKITKHEYDEGQTAAGLAGAAGDHNLSTIQKYAAHNATVQPPPYQNPSNAKPVTMLGRRRSVGASRPAIGNAK